MKNNIFYTLLLLLPFLAFSQKIQRQLLEGQVISDSLMVENITVRNVTANLVASTNDTGGFVIYARVSDTLQFTGLAIRDAQIVLADKHFKDRLLVVKLDIDVNVLDEVVVSDLTGNLEKDSKKIKVKNLAPVVDADFFDPNDLGNFKYQERNNALPQTESQLQGIDFKRIYRLFFKKKKRAAEPRAYVSNEPFAVVVRNRLEDDFFTETLKIPQAEIVQFLAYCEDGEKTTALLDPQSEFQLIDYLVTKSTEYLKNK